MLKLEKKIIYKFHLSIKLYEIRKESYDTKSFIILRSANLNRNIFS